MSSNQPYLSSSFGPQPAPPRRRSSSWGLFLWLIGGLAVAACALVVVVFSVLRNAEAAKMAVAQAESNAAVTQSIGSPLKVGWIVSGNVQVVNSDGHAELSVPVSGPKGSGTLYVEAKKRSGIWRLTFLEFAPKDGGERVKLIKPEETNKETSGDPE